MQLDESAFPLILAWRLQEHGFPGDFDPYPMVLKAARYLVEQSPFTPQERWEECAGYSPSTLEACIAGLVCAAQFARQREDGDTARFLEEYADSLESRVEAWTVATRGSLVPGITRHYTRILPADANDPRPPEDPDTGTLTIANAELGQPYQFPAKDIVDAGFLELVRYGIRKAGTPLVEDSLGVVDALLRAETPAGPCWRRYNNDGYGQQKDGGPFTGWGRGRPWPLLTGERGHYELAAGRDAKPYVQAMEGFASLGGMLPEQIWDAGDIPERELFFGRPKGSAMPLMRAHAEYVKLLRSVRDGIAFDRIAAVADRYLSGRGRKDLQIWKFSRQARNVTAGTTLRIRDPTPFRLRWSLNDWNLSTNSESLTTALGIHYADIVVPEDEQAAVRFSFFWPGAERWEGPQCRPQYRGRDSSQEDPPVATAMRAATSARSRGRAIPPG